MKSRTTIDTADYRAMMRELGEMKDDVIGFVHMHQKLKLGLAAETKAYRDVLKESGRKDRVIVVHDADKEYAENNAHDQNFLMRSLKGYTFENKFEIAVCDGVVFICFQADSEIIVHRLTDKTTYDAYDKLMTDLWIGADNNSLMPHEEMNYTVSQLKALLSPYNISDAHTHQQISKSQQKIVASLPYLWSSSHYTRQAEIEQKFTNTFFELRQCPTALKTGKSYINYSASAVIALVGNFLRTNHLSVSLISPCFDNLPDLLRDSGILPHAISETVFHSPAKLYERLAREINTDVLFIVNPNNPTGFCLDEYGEDGYRELARYCHDYRKILIADLCFMPFICRDGSFRHVDIYSILDEFGVDYVTIEDTGKIMPVMDTKAAILHPSEEMVSKFERLHTNYILRHSPFVLQIVTEFLLDGIQTNLKSSYSLFQSNFSYMADTFKKYDLPLQIKKRKANLSVAWIAITNKNISSQDIKNAARKDNIELLSGDKFFWNDPEKGSKFIRIAFARDPQEFHNTIDRFVITMLKLIMNK